MTSVRNAERYAFDTNVLFYSLDARSTQKHQLARKLIGMADQDRCVVPVQTLGELCNTAARKRPDLLPQARQLVEELQDLYTTVSASSDDVLDALAAHQQHGLQFWDALLWATTRRAGCRTLFSEDLQDGRTLRSVTFRNPFTMPPANLANYLS